MLKKRKGEIATLLTLGLVILGGVLAIGSSVFLSQQKTTSTRAAGGCGSGNNFTCDSKEGYNKTKCPNPNLEFACCVVDQGRGGCEGDTPYRYRWYGCTGQYCRNTKISTSGGPGHLVACPKEIPLSSVEDCYDKLDPSSGGLSAKPAGAEEPIKTPPRAGCESTFDEVQCGYLSQSFNRTLIYTVDKEGKKWCCPPGGGIGGSEKNDCEKKGHKCVSKIIGKSNIDICQTQLGTNYVYDLLSCGRSNTNQICCKKSTPPLPVGGSVPESEVQQPPEEAVPEEGAPAAASNNQCVVNNERRIDKVEIDSKQEIATKKLFDENKIAITTNKYNIIRFKKSNGTCGYDCIRKSNNQRGDCWTFQKNDRKNWLIIKNNTDNEINIKSINFLKRVTIYAGAIETSSKIYDINNANLPISPQESTKIDFINTEVQCNLDIVGAPLLYISILYEDSSKNLITLPTVNFRCEDDFVGLVNIN